ncbi:hypothetical protein ACW7BJ_27695 [Azospirillum argentinense]
MSLLSRCKLSLDDFVPVSNIEPATRNVVRVSIEPARPNENPRGRRLNVTMSGNVAEQIGAEVGKTCITAYMAPTPPFVLLRTETLAQAKARGAPIYKLGRAGKTEEALSHITCIAPFWTVQEKRASIEPKAFEIRDGALIVELPDSFIRPEYLTGAEASSAICVREPDAPPFPPEGVALRLGEPKTIPVLPAQADVLLQPEQPQPVEACDDQILDVATQVPDEAAESEGPATVHSSVDDAGLQKAERCITDPAPAPEKVSVPPTLEDRLYDHLLLLAREGMSCPDNQALASALKSNPNSISATLSMMKSRGRISVSYVSAEGKRSSDVVRGWQRVFTMVADKVTTAAPPPANVVLAETGNAASPVESPAAPPPKTVASAAPPRRVPLTPSKGRQLSEAELELQEVVGARKPVAAATDVDADFEYLRDKKVPVVRVSSNKTHPFRLNDRPATAAEITAKAARVRQISGGR